MMMVMALVMGMGMGMEMENTKIKTFNRLKFIELALQSAHFTHSFVMASTSFSGS